MFIKKAFLFVVSFLSCSQSSTYKIVELLTRSEKTVQQLLYSRTGFSKSYTPLQSTILLKESLVPDEHSGGLSLEDLFPLKSTVTITFVLLSDSGNPKLLLMAIRFLFSSTASISLSQILEPSPKSLLYKLTKSDGEILIVVSVLSLRIILYSICFSPVSQKSLCLYLVLLIQS